MAQRKVRSIGNSLGVVLPRETQSRLNLKDAESLSRIETTEGSMRITPYEPAFEAQMRAAREGMGQDRDALRELAE
jgi:putative addiction module antidote